MLARDFDYFILHSVLRGFRYRVIAAAIQHSEAGVALRMMEWRKRYHCKTNRQLFSMLFGEPA